MSLLEVATNDYFEPVLNLSFSKLQAQVYVNDLHL